VLLSALPLLKLSAPLLKLSAPLLSSVLTLLMSALITLIGSDPVCALKLSVLSRALTSMS
jgi:hypothetical protein